MTIIETKSTETKSTETKTEFASLCGFDFDPAKSSDCYSVCKKDEPEDFAKCLEHFQTLEVKPKAKASTAKGGRGKSFWGHINLTQAGLIDDCLVQADKPKTIQQIAEFAKGKLPRVLAHVKYLVKTKGAKISLTTDSHIFWDENPNMKGLKAHGCVTGLFIKKAPAVKTETKKTKKKEEGVVKKDAFSKIKVPADKTKTSDKDKKDKPVVKKKKAADKKPAKKTTPKTKELVKVKA